MDYSDWKISTAAVTTLENQVMAPKKPLRGTRIETPYPGSKRNNCSRVQSLKLPNLEGKPGPGNILKLPQHVNSNNVKGNVVNNGNIHNNSNGLRTYSGVINPSKLSRALTSKPVPIRTASAVIRRKPQDDNAEIKDVITLKRSLSIKHSQFSLSQIEKVRRMEDMIKKKIQDFPSVSLDRLNGNNIVPKWNWMAQYHNIFKDDPLSLNAEKVEKIETLLSQVSKCHNLIKQIRNDFKHGLIYEDDEDDMRINKLVNDFEMGRSGTRGRKTVGVSNYYISDVFESEKRQEEMYRDMTKKAVLKPEEWKERNSVVQWVCKIASTEFRYPAETTHLAVFLIDGFLGVKKRNTLMQHEGSWDLLGITALHIAGKLEEPRPISVNDLIVRSNKPPKKEDVYFFEEKMLQYLDFNVYPPLAPHFGKMVLFGGSLDFPSITIKKLVLDLSMAILFKSLTKHKLTSIKASHKAQLALEIAVEFIFFNLKRNKGKELGAYNISAHNPGRLFEEFDVHLCTDLFTQYFIAKTTPNIPQKLPKLLTSASRDRGVMV